MQRLELKDVPDDVVERLERLSARTGLSVEEFAVEMLVVEVASMDAAAALKALPDIGIAAETIVDDLRDARQERDEQLLRRQKP